MTHDDVMVSGRREQDPRLFADVQVSPLLSGGKYLWGVLDNVPDLLVESLQQFAEELNVGKALLLFVSSGSQTPDVRDSQTQGVSCFEKCSRMVFGRGT